MPNATSQALSLPGSETQSTLAEVIRLGAQRMLKVALEAEVDAHVATYVNERDQDGHRLVVRNGHHRARTIDTGVGPIEVEAPRVNDRRVDVDGSREHFASKILPPYLRRTQSLEGLIPWLYLKGISTGDFNECLQMLVGEGANSVSRQRSCGSRRSGPRSSRPGPSARSRAVATSTSGSTASTSTSASMANASASS